MMSNPGLTTLGVETTETGHRYTSEGLAINGISLDHQSQYIALIIAIKNQQGERGEEKGNDGPKQGRSKRRSWKASGGLFTSQSRDPWGKKGNWVLAQEAREWVSHTKAGAAREWALIWAPKQKSAPGTPGLGTRIGTGFRRDYNLTDELTWIYVRRDWGALSCIQPSPGGTGWP